eukprot:2867144-Alexandrium_andersonii.AAC.1
MLKTDGGHRVAAPVLGYGAEEHVGHEGSNQHPRQEQGVAIALDQPLQLEAGEELGQPSGERDDVRQ